MPFYSKELLPGTSSEDDVHKRWCGPYLILLCVVGCCVEGLIYGRYSFSSSLPALQCAARNPPTYEGRAGFQCCDAAKRTIQFLLVSLRTHFMCRFTQSPWHSPIFAEHLDLAHFCECTCSARSDSNKVHPRLSCPNAPTMP